MSLLPCRGIFGRMIPICVESPHHFALANKRISGLFDALLTVGLMREIAPSRLGITARIDPIVAPARLIEDAVLRPDMEVKASAHWPGGIAPLDG